MPAYPIKKFGTKMMVSTKAVNTIPDHYLSYARNARIYDGGIGPRRGKELLTNSTLGTNNKGGFVMGGNLYQIANSKIYQINETTGVQTEKATLGYDAVTDILVYGANIAIISSPGKDLKLYDGATTVTTITTDPASFPSANTGILEYCRGFSFCAGNNVLYISRPITPANPEYSYDFVGSGAQQITFDTTIYGLKATLDGIYIFTENQVQLLDANSLQNVAGSATFISRPLGESSYPVNNLCIAASGNKIFYITKNLHINTINYIQYTADSTIGELSAQPIVGIKEFLNNIDTTQATAFAFYNETDKTIQMHLRSVGSPFNDVVLIYDLINDTWVVDSQKSYNYVVRKDNKYYGFSDINSSIYLDDVGYSDAGIAIPFRIETQNLSLRTPNQKIFTGLYTMGAIGSLTNIEVLADIDAESIFQDYIEGTTGNIGGIGEIGGAPIGGTLIGGALSYQSSLTPFDKRADVGRIYQGGQRMKLVFQSASQIQDFIIDSVGIFFEPTNFVDQSNVF